MCVPILRSILTKLTKLENMQKSCFIWRDVIRQGDYDASDRYFDQEYFETNQKSLRLSVMVPIVVLVFSVTLTFDLC